MKRRRSYLKWLAAAILIVAVYKLHQSGYASEIPSIESGTAGIANAPVYKVVIDPGHGGDGPRCCRCQRKKREGFYAAAITQGKGADTRRTENRGLYDPNR